MRGRRFGVGGVPQLHGVTVMVGHGRMREAIEFFDQILRFEQDQYYRRSDEGIVPIASTLTEQGELLGLVGIGEPRQPMPIRFCADSLRIELRVADISMPFPDTPCSFLTIGVVNRDRFVMTIQAWMERSGLYCVPLGNAPQWTGVSFPGFLGCGLVFTAAYDEDVDPL